MLNRKLRILHVNLSASGIQHYGTLFARGLSNQSDIEVLSLIEESVQKKKVLWSLTKGLNKKLIPCRKLTDRMTIYSTLKHIISDWKPDVIHDTAGSSYIYGSTPLAFASKNIPFVVTEHDPEPHMGMGKSSLSRFSRHILRKKSSHIFVHGPQGKQVLENHGVSPDQISVVYHGTYKTIFDSKQTKQINREENSIIFFGELRPNKGFRLLLPIAEKINSTHPQAKFIVAGSSKVARDLRKTGWDKELRAILNQMRERPYFEVHERFIPEEEVGGYFRRASMTLLPYLDASQSGVAMIAMPLGSVILATRVGDLPYVIEHGRTGLITDPDVERIVEELSYALSNPQKLKDIRQEAIRWVEECCNWDRIAEKSVPVYRKLVQSN